MPPVRQTYKLQSGEVIELFYIGALATALGRTPNTIRRWEISGIIPDPCFRDPYNKRLYSQEQIDAICVCAERARIMQGSSIGHTNFSKWCYKALETIQRKYMGGNL